MHFAATTIFCALMISLFAGNSFAAEWKSISEADNRIIYYPPDDQGPPIQHAFKGWDEGYSYRQWYLGIPGSAKQPRLQVWFTDLADGTHYPNTREPEDLIMDYTFFQDKAPTKMQSGSSETAVGPTPFVQFSVENRFCFVFEQTFGQSGTMTTSSGTMRLTGYYCEKIGSTLNHIRISNILTRLGVTKVGVPSATLKQAYSTRADTTSRPNSGVAKLGDVDLCNLAVRKTETNVVKWESRKVYQDHVKIARERGLSVTDCALLAGHTEAVSSKKDIQDDSSETAEKRLQRLKDLLSKELITKDAYDEKVKKILEKL